jgi:hypothetical protein
MDDRQCRIGEHAVQERPLWAPQALGQVPAEPATARRMGGQGRAARRVLGRCSAGTIPAGRSVPSPLPPSPRPAPKGTTHSRSWPGWRASVYATSPTASSSRGAEGTRPRPAGAVFVQVYVVVADAGPAPSAIVAAPLAPARVAAIDLRIETCPCRLGPRVACGGRSSARGTSAVTGGTVTPAGRVLARCVRAPLQPPGCVEPVASRWPAAVTDRAH